MKKAIFKTQSFLLLVLFSFIQLTVLAQEDNSSSSTTSSSKTTISVTDSTDTGNWYTSPWVWIIGAAIFILLLIALLSNRGDRSDTTVVREKNTVIRDRDVDAV